MSIFDYETVKYCGEALVCFSIYVLIVYILSLWREYQIKH